MGTNSAFFLLAVLGVSCYAAVAAPWDIITDLIFASKCLKNLGCFYNGPPFYDPILRPISLLPFDLKDMKTKFWLYTSLNETTLLEPNKASLAKSSYDKELGLHIFIHGFMMDLNGEALEMVEDIIKQLKAHVKSNVILVDWTASNKDPYPQAVANGRVVGAQVAELIKFLKKETGLDPKNVHIMGHSLGAHVSGWAGERIPKLGRISGLDPAGPYFRKGDRKIRLDDTDAIFVDVIHSNGADNTFLGLGIVEPIGHVDFYPNGGTSQPGCQPFENFGLDGFDIDLNIFKKKYKDLIPIVCNHMRAVNYFVESMDNSKCKFVGTQCGDYDKYKLERCKASKKVEMGFYSRKNPNVPVGSKFYLRTSEKEPFCINT